MHLTFSRLAILLAATALPAAAASAQPPASGPALLEGLFQDNAVFQRDRPASVWGRALPGEDVTIRFAGRSVRVRADRTGAWTAQLPAQPAGGPYQLTVTTPRGASQSIVNVMVGDVWLCSGQSNMEMDVSRALAGPSEIANATDSQIRLLTVSHDTSFTPLADFKTPVRWQPVSPASVADFSAACYFMARELRTRQKVPIGLIDASWGGTAIDAWRSEGVIETAGGLTDRLAVMRAYRRDAAEGNRLWGAIWEDWWRQSTGDPRGREPWQPSAAGDWKAVPRLANWESWGDPELADYNGTMWYRTTVRLTPQQAQAGILDIGWADDIDQTWVNGVPVGNTNGPNSSRAYALAPGLLKAGENSIVVNVFDAYAGGGLIGPEGLRAITLADGTRVPLGGPWQYRVAAPAGRWPPHAPWEANSGLATIYNGMVAPLGRYGLKGIAWYQGESDANGQRGYAAKLTSLMGDWRTQFGQSDLPFLVVQLAGWGPASAVPTESGSALVRDEQRLAVARDPNAGLAVAIDLGDREDIHPADKQEVGLRLARAARHVAYGEPITPSGPEAARASRSGNRVTVQFNNVEGGLISYSAARPIGFELCGADQASCRFVDASIAGSAVNLEADGAPATRVRFCWGDSPVCNLYDRSGLPAGPFELRIE